MTQRQSQVKVLTTQKFADLCLTTPRTIRFYDKLKLLKPAHVEESTGYRYFDPSQAREVFYIKLLQTFGVPLKEIKALMGHQTAEYFLHSKVKNIALEIEERKKELAFLKNVQSLIAEEGSIRANTEMVGPYILLCKDIKHGRYDEIENIVSNLYSESRELGIETTNKNITLYKDPYHYRPVDSHFEVGVVCKLKSIPKRILLPQGLQFKKFPRQKVLVCNYKGPFEYITFVHKRMVELTKDQKLTGFPFDLTIDGPWNKSSKYDYLTKVGYPIY